MCGVRQCEAILPASWKLEPKPLPVPLCPGPGPLQKLLKDIKDTVLEDEPDWAFGYHKQLKKLSKEEAEAAGPRIDEAFWALTNDGPLCSYALLGAWVGAVLGCDVSGQAMEAIPS